MPQTFSARQTRLLLLSLIVSLLCLAGGCAVKTGSGDAVPGSGTASRLPSDVPEELVEAPRLPDDDASAVTEVAVAVGRRSADNDEKTRAKAVPGFGPPGSTGLPAEGRRAVEEGLLGHELRVGGNRRRRSERLGGRESGGSHREPGGLPSVREASQAVRDDEDRRRADLERDRGILVLLSDVSGD